mgnify:CR=1 FL=1|tara:strand:+ start:86 stop:589 length:504 start_codon:yes stop_codon:yes gene_type:complete
MMQTDVKAAHLNNTGFALIGPTRLKALATVGTATAGTLDIFDTITAPVSATYERAATLVTVTKVAHGLVTGAVIGLSFASASGSSATNGNYVVTVLTSSTFTITDINTGTIAAGTACLYSTRWVVSYDIGASDVYGNNALLPGEGIKVFNGIHLTMTNIVSSTIYYG